MKRLQIYIDEDLDDALEQRARRERRSKAALIREAVRAAMADRPLTKDPFESWIGGSDVEPASIDEVVYDA